MSDISQMTLADGVTYDLKDSVARSQGGTTYTAYTLTSSGWSNGVYSLETQWPSATYDIVDVLPNSTTTTAAQRTAWVNADCGGYESTNIIRAHGTVPTVDIPVIVCTRRKA